MESKKKVSLNDCYSLPSYSLCVSIFFVVVKCYGVERLARDDDVERAGIEQSLT